MKLFMAVLFVFIQFITHAMNLPPEIKLDVLVVDDGGNPVHDALVSVIYPERLSKNDAVFRERTDQEGRATFTGKSLFSLRVFVEKPGCYPSRRDVVTVARVDRQQIYSNQEVTIELRSIKKPIPMYAVREARVVVPNLHEMIGYDMVRGDWIAPHGQGITADLYFKVTGQWTSFYNHDSYLHVTFPNPGDGIQSFVAHKDSAFKSPYEAPTEGYLPEKTLHKARKSTLVEGFENKYDTVIVDTSSHEANYIIRVRTVLDHQGRVLEARYGKIHGDFVFHGASQEDRYSPVVFSYYLNPILNDRNLEFDPAQNLRDGLNPWNQPKDP